MPYPLLTDRRTGIVRRLLPAPAPRHFPAGFELIASHLSDTTRFSDWPADSAGAGYAFADPEAALGAALGEAAERYCGNLVPEGLVRASYRDLCAQGRRAVDPAALALYGAEQYAQPGFPVVEFTADLEAEWAHGTDLVTGEPVLVPAALVWVSYLSADVRPRGPRTNPVIQAGLAAGAGWPDAVAGALAEVVERDAMTMGWHGRAGLRPAQPPPWLELFARGPEDALEVRFLSFPDLFGHSVQGALVHDRVTGYLTLGTAARADEEAAQLKAYGEALQLQLFCADYDDRDGPYMRAAADPRSPLKPWRARRDYAAAYRTDLADAVDYGCHLQLHLDPAVQAAFRTELATALSEGPPRQDRPPAHDLARSLAEAGHEVVAVDLTTPDVREAGLRVARVVVPGLYSNTAAGLPFLGGTRLAASLAGAPRRTLPLPH